MSISRSISRLAALAALAFASAASAQSWPTQRVTLVVPFDEDTPLALIKTIRPDHLVKGGDWPPEQIVGADIVQSYSGQVHSIPFRFQRSTTDLIRRIRVSGEALIKSPLPLKGGDG